VGPAKVGLAYDAGFQSFDRLSHAPFDQLAAIPGFGPFVASELVGAFGGEVPTRPARPRPVLVRPSAVAADLPSAADEPRLELPLSVSLPPMSPPSLPTLSAPDPVIVAATPLPPAPPPIASEPFAAAMVEAAPAAPPLVPPPLGVPDSPGRTVFPMSPSRRPDTPSLAAAPLVGRREPEPEPIPAAPSGPTSGVRLSLTGREEESWRKFLDATSAGHRGLCLSREFPERRRALLGPRDVEVVWLSNVGKGSAVRPGDLPALTAILTKALGERDVTAIFVEGGEYLVRLHGAAPVAALLRQLDELAVQKSARLWLPINPALMAPHDVETLVAAVGSEPVDHEPPTGTE